MLDYELAAIAEREWAHPLSAVVPLKDPAAGAAVTFSNPGAVVSELQTITAKLVTSSAVAVRVPYLTVSGPGGAVLGTFPAGFTYAASKTVVITWGVGLVSFGANDGTRAVQPIPAYVLEVGYTVTITADLIDAADQFSLAVLTAKQWPVRPPIGN